MSFENILRNHNIEFCTESDLPVQQKSTNPRVTHYLYFPCLVVMLTNPRQYLEFEHIIVKTYHDGTYRVRVRNSPPLSSFNAAALIQNSIQRIEEALEEILEDLNWI